MQEEISKRSKRSQRKIIGNSFVSRINFQLLSREEIEQLSVCSISSSANESLYNLKMGPMRPKEICTTCGQNPIKCQGHFGRIDIPDGAEFIHPWYLQSSILVNLLNVFCYPYFAQTGNVGMRISEKLLIELHETTKGMTPEGKLDTISSKVMSYPCYSEEDEVTTDVMNTWIAIKLPDKNQILIDNKDSKKRGKGFYLSARKLFPYLKKISDYVESSAWGHNLAEFLGFSKGVRFENFIVRSILVPPNCMRPNSVVAGNEIPSDITLVLQKILKTIEIVSTIEDIEKRQLYSVELAKQFSDYIAPKSSSTASTKDLKTLTAEIKGKKGLIRGSTTSKRVDNSSRTVIVGSNTIAPDEIGVPKKIAKKQRVLLTVTDKNINKANQLLRDGKIRMIRKMTSKSVSFVAVTDENRDSFELAPGDVCKRELLDGDVVVMNRQPTLWRNSVMAHKVKLVEGFAIVLNDAQTKGYNADFDGDAMHMFTPVTLEGRIDTVLNMDIGRNIISSQGSTPVLQLIQNDILGATRMTRENKPMDYKTWFSYAESIGYEKEFLQKRIEYVIKNAPAIFERYGVKNWHIYSPLTLFSLTVPPTFSWRQYKVNGTSKTDSLIRSGIFVRGIFGKAALGGAPNSISQTMLKSGMVDQIVPFMMGIQRIVGKYLTQRAHTIRLEDFVPSKNLKEKLTAINKKAKDEAMKISQTQIMDVFSVEDFKIYLRDKNVETKMIDIIAFHVFDYMRIERALIERGDKNEYDERKIITAVWRAFDDGKRTQNFDEEMNRISEITINYMNENFMKSRFKETSKYDKFQKEATIINVLSNASKEGTQILFNTLKQNEKDNYFYEIVSSGARANEFNINQSMNAMGQQMKGGKRLDGGLPFYDRKRGEAIDDPKALGYIQSSLVEGLSPAEYANAAIPSRESQLNTAIGTADTGYLTRKFHNILGNISVWEDGTCRDNRGQIFTFAYGDGSFDPTMEVKVGGEFNFINIQLALEFLEEDF